MLVAFRADASVQIGTGHIMRCLTLAEELRHQGHQCRFICRDHQGHLGNLIANKGFRLELLPSNAGAIQEDGQETSYAEWLGVPWQLDAEQTLTALDSAEPDWIVVDHYALDVLWEKQVSRGVSRVTVIDDLADRFHQANLLLNQNLGGAASDYEGLLPPSCKTLIGPEYALLRPEFSRIRPESLRKRSEPILSRILVSMGGVDAPNATAAVLRSLEASSLPSNIQLDVVMGATAPWLSEIQESAKGSRFSVTVSTNVQNMGERMLLADLSIGAAGSTSWERCALGLPSIVVSQAFNQSAILTALSDAGAAVKLNFPFDDNELSGLVTDFYEHPEKLARMATNASRLCDGRGAHRVVGWLDDSQ